MSEEDMGAEIEDISPPVEDEVDAEQVANNTPEPQNAEQKIKALKEGIKKSRWNVFLLLGVSLVMFGFALFPLTMSVPYDELWGTSEKDLGYVWGPSSPGEDILDVPFELDVEIVRAPSVADNVTLEVYILKAKDCQDLSLSELEVIARGGNSHNNQFQSLESPLEGETYTFDFDLDMGHYCTKVQFVDSKGETLKQNTRLNVNGKLWPNQVVTGLPGIVFLGLSIFAFIGSQKKSAKLKSILEKRKVSEEQLILEAVSEEKIAQGPAGPPQSADGPSGPPQSSSGPSGPPQKEKKSGPPQSMVSQDTSTSKRSGPPPTSTTVEIDTHQQGTPDSLAEVEPTQETVISNESTFEPAGNGYFYRKMPDGTYEQVIYVQSADGTYIPYQQ
ncbi:MAG: hypothetical protein CBE08_003815 [Euryarchaeota archaeon TMED248]|nr:MAG: hypothetical protein CBE08_003815 [Euryarchaeota archaeon TMED248]